MVDAYPPTAGLDEYPAEDNPVDDIDLIESIDPRTIFAVATPPLSRSTSTQATSPSGVGPNYVKQAGKALMNGEEDPIERSKVPQSPPIQISSQVAAASPSPRSLSGNIQFLTCRMHFSHPNLSVSGSRSIYGPSPPSPPHSSANSAKLMTYPLIPIEINTTHSSSLKNSPRKLVDFKTTPTRTPPQMPEGPVSDPSRSQTAAGLEDDPFKLMGTLSVVAPDVVENRDDIPDEDMHEELPEEEIPAYQQVWWVGRSRSDKHVFLHACLHLPLTRICRRIAQEASGQSLKIKTPASRTLNRQAGPSRRKAGVLHSGASLDSASSQSKGAKRKRGPSSIPIRLTRSLSTTTKAAVKGKGKGKLKETNDAGSENGSVSSGASAASKILRIPSRDSSRASSIASTPSIDSSSLSVQPSPTFNRPSGNSNGQSKIPLMFHAHSGGHHHHHHHHHHGPPGASRSSAMNQARSLSSSQSNGTTSQAKSRPAPTTNSPVTRSNCRFHRISLPREEHGPRVSFIVPGCSLRDRELMIEEEIEDHGDATHSDHERMIGDIESLDFSVELIATLRLLCGVDLIRENEVFYLPEPGESHRRKRHGKSKSMAARSSLGSISVSANHDSSTSPRFVKTHKPSASSSSAQNFAHSLDSPSSPLDKNKEDMSFWDGELTEPEDTSSTPKRAKKNATAEEPKESAQPQTRPQDNAATIVIPSPARRKSDAKTVKNSGSHAFVYIPQLEEEESSGDELAKKPLKSDGRGLKRTRTSDVHGSPKGPSEQPIAKRLRNDDERSSVTDHAWS